MEDLRSSRCRGCDTPLTPMKRQGRKKEWCSAACFQKSRRRAAGNWVSGEQRPCDACQAPFMPKCRNQRYCTPRCGWISRSQRLDTKQCELCTTTFVGPRTRRFCSDPCSNRGRLMTKGIIELRCRGCGGEPVGRGLWCSDACRDRHRPPQRRTCPTCGQTFERKGRGKSGAKYCGTDCRPRLHGPPEPQPDSCPLPWADCRWCGRSFVAITRKCYCTDACSRLSNDDRRTAARPIWYVDCEECGCLFVARTSNTRYCSTEHSNRAQHRRAKAKRRARQLQAPYEHIVPRKVFDRDGWICQLCHEPVERHARVPNPRAPTIDHIQPLALGGSETYANVQCAHFDCNWIKGTDTAFNRTHAAI